MTDTEPTPEISDAQIRGALLWHWKHEFQNWGGDSLNEAVMDFVPGDVADSDEQENALYERACLLLDGARIQIEWGTSDAEVIPHESDDIE